LVFSKTSEKCSTFPAPLEAMTGMVIASLTCRSNSMSKPLLVPADFGTQKGKVIVSSKLLDFSQCFLCLTQPFPNCKG